MIHFTRDFAQQKGSGKITRETASQALELLEIDSKGLDEMDKRILRIIGLNYKGGPVGLGTVAVAVGEEEHTLEEVHEPFLIQEGYLKKNFARENADIKRMGNNWSLKKTNYRSRTNFLYLNKTFLTSGKRCLNEEENSFRLIFK